MAGINLRGYLLHCLVTDFYNKELAQRKVPVGSTLTNIQDTSHAVRI